MTDREMLEEIEALQADYKRLQDECKELRYILSRVAAAVEHQPAPDISALVEALEALEAIQKIATHDSIRTGIRAAAVLGGIAAICDVALADYRKLEVFKSDLTPKDGGYQPSRPLVSNPPGDET